MIFVPSLMEIGPLVLEKKILKFQQYIFAILELSPFEKSLVHHLKLELPLLKDALRQAWFKLVQYFLRLRWKCE